MAECAHSVADVSQSKNGETGSKFGGRIRAFGGQIPVFKIQFFFLFVACNSMNHNE